MAKKLDITKTGPAGWKQLQEANAADVTGVGSDFSDWLTNLKSASTPISLYDARAHAEKDIMSPLTQNQTHSGKQDYWGNSAFDSKSANEDEFRRLSDIRAENQPWVSKLANGVGKAGVLALTTAAEGILGIPYGLATAPFTGKFSTIWDNHITRVLQDIRDGSEELMPNYYTEDEINNPFSHIFTSNFLGDKILKNLGFMVGAFYSGIPVAKGLGALGVNAVKAARSASLAERAGMAERVGELTAGYGDDVVKKAAQYGRDIAGLSDDAAAKVASQYGDDAVNLHKALAAEHLTEAERKARILAGMEKVNNIAQTTRYTTQTLGALASAINEGAIEAIDNSRDWEMMQKQILDDKYQEEIAEIQQQYGDSQEGYDALINAQNKYQQELAAIEEGRAAMGNADLLLNIPILTASNIFQLGRLYNRGFDSARREMGRGLFHPKLAGEMKLGSSNLHSTKTWKGAIGSALAKSNTEGLEEYLQRAASDGAGNAVSDTLQRFFTGGQSEDSKADAADYILGFGKSIIDNLGDQSAWEEYLIGALSSTLGMPVFGRSQTRNAVIGKGKSVGVAGGIIGNYQDYMKSKEKEDDVAKYLNGRLNDPNFMALYDSFRKNGDLDKAIMEAVINDDKATYKSLEFEKLFNDINAAASSGHFEEFKALIGYNHDYTDDELKEIAESTTHKVTAEQQRDADIAKREWLLGKLNWYELNGVTTEAEKADVYSFQQELDAIESRLAGEYKDGKLIDIAESTQYKDREEGPFVMTNANGNTIHMYLDGDENNPESGKSKMIGILEKNRTDILQAMDDYLRIRNNIDVETDGHLGDKEIAILTLIRAKILNIDTRSTEMWKDIQDSLGAVGNDVYAAESSAMKNLENAQNKVKEAKTDQEKATAEIELQKLKEEYADVLYIANLIRAISSEKDASLNEQIAYEKGLTGKGWFSSVASVLKSKFNDIFEREGDEEWTGSKRPINSDELLEILAHPGNALNLIRGIKASPSLDNATKLRLMDEVRSLSYLANEKIGYNQKVREYLGDPTLISKDQQKYEDKLSKEEKDNITNELSLRMQKAKNMMELDSILREAFSTYPSIADAALQKSRESKDPAVKAMMDDYSKARKYFSEFNIQVASLPSEISEGLSETVMDSWQTALADSSDGSLYDKFINGLKEAVSLLREDGKSGNKVAKRNADELERIMNDISNAQKVSATNSDTLETPSKKGKTVKKATVKKTVKNKGEEKGDSESKGTEIFKKISEYKQRFNDAETLEELDEIYQEAKDENLGDSLEDAYNERKTELQKTNPIEDTEEILRKAILDAVSDALDDGNYISSIKGLPDKLFQRIEKYNKNHPDNMIKDAVVAQLLKEAADSKLIDIEYEEPDDDDVDDSREGSEVARRMIENLRATFTSDGHTKYRRYSTDGTVKLYYKTPYPQTDPQGEAIQKLLDDNHAYDFMDRNLLGYLSRVYEERGDEIPIYFVKSTDDNVNGPQDSPHAIFLAVKITPQDESILKAKSGRSDLSDSLNLFTIGDSNYQIVGELSMVGKSAPEVSTAFKEFQDHAGIRLNKAIEKAKKDSEESGTKLPSFVLYTDNDDNPITSRVNTVNTGRLEKSTDGKDDEDEKRNLFDFVSESSEWEAEGEFPFGVVVNGDIEIDGVQKPNADWMNKHNGAIVMFVPRPDGSMYPVRCTRRSVAEWMKSNGDFLPSGETMLKQLLSGDMNNEYLGEIVDLLRTLFNDEATPEQWVRAKYLLCQYFIFGKHVPIHGDPGNITFSFMDNGEVKPDSLDTEDDSVENKITAFFEMLGRHNVLFTMPSVSKTEFDSRDIVSAGIFQTGLKGFYNFNSNFTIDPINSKGGRIIVSTPVSDDIEVGGDSYNPGAREYSIDGTTRSYIIDNGTVKYASGSPVTDSNEANLVSMANSIYEDRKNGEVLFYRFVPEKGSINDGLRDAAINHFLSSPYNEVYIIEIDGVNWVYDRRGGGKANVIYNLESKEGKTLQKEISKAYSEFASKKGFEYLGKENGKPESSESGPASPEESKKPTNKKKKKTAGKKDEKKNPDEPVVSEYVFVGKTIDDIDPKSSSIADLLVSKSSASKANRKAAEKILEILQSRELAKEDTTSQELKEEIEKIFETTKPKDRNALIEKLKNCKKS